MCFNAPDLVHFAKRNRFGPLKTSKLTLSVYDFFSSCKKKVYSNRGQYFLTRHVGMPCGGGVREEEGLDIFLF